MGQSVFQTPSLGIHLHDNIQSNKPVKHDSRVWALSTYYMILRRPTQALPLARTYCYHFIFKYIFKI